MSRTQTRKKFLLIGYLPSSIACFSITKKLQRVFSSTSNSAWQFSCKWNRRCAILPQTQICKFGRTKFDTLTILSRDEVLISLFILLQVLLSSWCSERKVHVQLFFPHNLTFHLRAAKNLFNNFLGSGGGVNFGGRFWKIQRGGGVIRQIPSLGGVWIFSGTTH